MQQRKESPPPDAGEAELFELRENRTGGGDEQCTTSITRQRAIKLRNEATEAEKTLWKRLRKRQILGYKFRRQQPLGKYIVDFVCFEKRLIVEVDGSQHYEQKGYDEKRSRWLESQGYRVIRFWNDEVLVEPEIVVDVIAEELGD